MIRLALVLALIAATAPQHIGDGELQRFVYTGRYPLGCTGAQLTVTRYRVDPTLDPAALRTIAQTFRSCATSDYGLESNALANRSNFAAAAALLLAARHDSSGAEASSDASAARELSQTIISFTRGQPRNGRPSEENVPSPLITDAGRINRDAAALLSSTAGGGGAPA